MNKKHCFISYSSKDRKFVERLATDLIENNLEIFFDKWEIQVGDSKLFRMAMEDILGISVADSTKTPPLPIEFTTVRGFWQKFRDELVSTPKKQEQFDSFFNEWAGKFLTKWLSQNRLDLEKANEMWDPFREHEKIGRPKNPKKKRGKQKDTGI